MDKRIARVLTEVLERLPAMAACDPMVAAYAAASLNESTTSDIAESAERREAGHFSLVVPPAFQPAEAGR